MCLGILRQQRRKLTNGTRSYSLVFCSSDESTDVSNTIQLAVFFRRSHVKFCVTEELAAFVPVKGTTTRADLYENRCRKFRMSQKLDALVMDGAPRNRCMCSLLTNDMKNTTDRDLIISHFFLHHQSSCAKLFRMENVFPLLRQI
jgi:hypothetical protein